MRLFGVVAVMCWAWACQTAPEATVDFNKLDSLILHKDYPAAKMIIEQAYVAPEDTITALKLAHRRDRIERRLFFDPLMQQIRQGDTSGVIQKCEARLRLIKREQPQRWRWYKGEQHRLLAVMDSLSGDEKGWVENWDAFMHLPADGYHQKIRAGLRLSLFFAGKDSMVTARSYLDKALRLLPKKKFSDDLNDIYALYMNGAFDSARHRLNMLPGESLTVFWRQTREFLNQYGDRLNMKDRYKLW
ncbi:MAG: hypothetical protein D6677_01655 [Calditrichaeota bacterium]|nr:MAG: hypothetical protein D6677_01655 [Calditrichota bacterium]